tara:strand:+ start:1581 stop:1886 length:306 start_codon:yes stop_codon:yes gene_type:complete
MIDQELFSSPRTYANMLGFCKTKGWTPVAYFPIAHLGWESDNDGLVARDTTGVGYILYTNHGRVCEMTAETLDYTINETSEWLAQQVAARDALACAKGHGT